MPRDATVKHGLLDLQWSYAIRQSLSRIAILSHPAWVVQVLGRDLLGFKCYGKKYVSQLPCNMNTNFIGEYPPCLLVLCSNTYQFLPAVGAAFHFHIFIFIYLFCLKARVELRRDFVVTAERYGYSRPILCMDSMYIHTSYFFCSISLTAFLIPLLHAYPCPLLDVTSRFLLRLLGIQHVRGGNNEEYWYKYMHTSLAHGSLNKPPPKHIMTIMSYQMI